MSETESTPPLDLDDLQRLADEAWPPPWEKFGNTVTLKLKGGIVHTIILPGDHQTLAFIAAARTAVPDLIARLITVEQERDILAARSSRWCTGLRCS